MDAAWAGEGSGKRERAAGLLREAAASFISTVSNRTSLITVTNTTLSRDGTRGRILVTVLPQEQEKAVVDFLNRQRGDLREYLKKHAAFKRLPFVLFEIDEGEKNRQQIDERLEDL